jgi:hypothetical protein
MVEKWGDVFDHRPLGRGNWSMAFEVGTPNRVSRCIPALARGSRECPFRNDAGSPDGTSRKRCPSQGEDTTPGLKTSRGSPSSREFPPCQCERPQNGQHLTKFLMHHFDTTNVAGTGMNCSAQLGCVFSAVAGPRDGGLVDEDAPATPLGVEPVSDVERL